MALPHDPGTARRLLGEPPRNFGSEIVQTLRGGRPGVGVGWASLLFGLLCLGAAIGDRLIDHPTMPERGAAFTGLVGAGLVGIGWHLRRRGLRHRARVRRALPGGPALVGQIEKATLNDRQGVLKLDIAYTAPDGRACRFWGTWNVLPGYEGPGAGSPVLLLLDPEDHAAATVFPFDYPELEDVPMAAPPLPETPLDALHAAWQAHQAEIGGEPEPAARARALMEWRQQIDEHAHDYADLVAGSHDDEMVKAEVEAIMTAWIAGHLARLGHFDPFQALQCAHQLGRALRDRARQRGLPIDRCQASLGVRMDQALRSIVDQGLGRAG